ncbi:hypothetical protein SK128_017209 [Halocaridina rubra]|uniref:Uncharacterized protein n=1 Tax=Halocaridina rubra TaxID=373956 RepID=A0AAN8X1I0_HALRR
MYPGDVLSICLGDDPVPRSNRLPVIIILHISGTVCCIMLGYFILCKNTNARVRQNVNLVSFSASTTVQVLLTSLSVQHAISSRFSTPLPSVDDGIFHLNYIWYFFSWGLAIPVIYILVSSELRKETWNAIKRSCFGKTDNDNIVHVGARLPAVNTGSEMGDLHDLHPSGGSPSARERENAFSNKEKNKQNPRTLLYTSRFHGYLDIQMIYI